MINFVIYILEKQKEILCEIKNSLNLIHEHPLEVTEEGEQKMLEDKLKNLIDSFMCLLEIRSNELHTKELLLEFIKKK